MTDKKQPEALRLADALERPGYGWHSTPAQCAAELRHLHTENETLRTGYAAARLEIASLRETLASQAQAVGAAPAAEIVTTAHGFETTLFLLPGHFDLPYGTHLLYAVPQPAARALASQAQPVGAAHHWVPVGARLPEPGKPVLLDIGTEFPIRAMWAAKHTVEAGDDDTDWGEYDEATDTYYCPEGWYEWNQNEEKHWAVSETPRAWRELPAVPGPADGESNELC